MLHNSLKLHIKLKKCDQFMFSITSFLFGTNMDEGVALVYNGLIINTNNITINIGPHLMFDGSKGIAKHP